MNDIAPTVPWFRDPDDLPCPLPTKAQIEAATTAFPSIFDAASRRTVLLNDVFVVKYGWAVFENEGRALLLVEKYPDVPAPRLYAMYREDAKLYIVMEFVAGHRLCDVWERLSEDDKLPLIGQLRLAFDSLRSIPSPGWFGGAQGGPLPHRFFFSHQKDARITGPLTDEQDVYRALILRSTKNWERWGRRGWMTEFFSRHLPAALTGHDSVFAHSDFQRKNIVVQEVHHPASASEPAPRTSFRLAAIVDWETAGWYPNYWDYALCCTYFEWSDDWPEKVERVLDPWITEAALLRMVALDLDL